MDREVRATLTRHRKRVETITKTLAGYGLAAWLPASAPGVPGGDEGRPIKDEPVEARLRMAFTDLGPAFVKLGQMLSTRADLVGPEVAGELAKLRSDVPADDPETVVAAVEAELEMPVERAYAEFDAVALGSGSIGQVHRARLLDGSRVVVKVLHDGIEDTIARDCEIMEALATLAEGHMEEARQLRAPELARQFRAGLLGELDFNRERANMQHFADRYNARGVVHFPVAYPELSGRRVLTMEELPGPTLDAREELERQGADTDALVQAAADTYMEMLFEDGVYHADPHPGNLVAMPDGRSGFLDSGLVGHLDEETKDRLTDLVVATRQRNAGRVTSVLLRLGQVPASLDRDALESDVQRWMDDYLATSLDDLDMGTLIQQSMEIVRRHHVVLSPDMVLMAKVLVELEGTLEEVGASIDVDTVLDKHAPRLVLQQFSPQRLGRELQRHGQDWLDLLDQLPRDAQVLLRRMSTGEFSVRLDINRLDVMVNRIVYGLIIAALFLGSALLLAFDVPPTAGGVSVTGAIGGLIGLGLLIHLLRAVHRRGGL